jgi:hypothetical protein
MLRSPSLRAVLIVAVLLAQFGLLLWGGVALDRTNSPENHLYPNEYALTLDYDAYVGERAEVRAEVVSTDPLVIERGFLYQDFRARVVGLDLDASPGDTVEVFGVVEEDATIRAIDGFVVPEGSNTYAYVVSGLAGLWVLGRIVRGWTLSTERGNVGLRPRDRERRDA